MFSLTKKIIEKLLNFGLADADEFGNDLNQKRVVNFSCLVFCLKCFFMFIFFASMQMAYISAFSLACLFIGLAGWRYNYLGDFEKAQLLMPLIKSVLVAILSLYYFGEDSGFHWFFASVIVYTFIVFRADQFFIKCVLVLVSLFLFSVCEYFSIKKLYLSPEEQSTVSVIVFISVTFYFMVVISLVMNRLTSANSNLRSLAEKDELTGLSNRRKVLADADYIFTDSIKKRSPCVFAIVDLDHFKKINDTYGHEAGDLVLAQVATMMRSAIRPQDEIGRYGGEEFIVIMRNTNLKQAEIVVEHIRQSVEDMFIETEQGIIIPVTISAGLASSTSDITRYEEVLSQADKGLYVAKRNGRNRIFVQSDFQN